MGNHHSSGNIALKPRKNVHWKSAGRPAPPGKPAIVPVLSDDEPNAVTLRWTPPVHDGGAALQGYQVECNRLGSRDWIRTAPPVVIRPELVLTGLDPPHRYQFRVAALNTVGRSEYSELSDILTVSSDRFNDPPLFIQHLEPITALENDKTEFRITFSGIPTPTIAWFKDDYEIFSSRRTAITTNESTSVLIFHQTLPSDEGEIKCTATNRAGHAVTKTQLSLEATPKLRYPRQYEDGLLYEINETIFLKTTLVGKPTPVVEWWHDGQPIVTSERIEITSTPRFSVLKIHSAKRSDRGEYQIHAKNRIGEDTASFLVTVTAPPDRPRCVSVTRQVDRSATLDWEPPEDDGGCRIGNYIVEYYRKGWNVWLKATTSRKTNVTLFDLIEGSEYRFRVKAESPYGMSAPSAESMPVRIPGRAVDMEFLAVESRIINEVLTRENGEEQSVSPAPRRKRPQPPGVETLPAQSPRANSATPTRERAGSNEFLLVLYPDKKSTEKTEKRKSFQLDLEDALSPPPISLSAPELSSRNILPFKSLRNAVSSTELLHERAMARFYKAVAMKEEKNKSNETKSCVLNDDIPIKTNKKHSKNEDSVVTNTNVVTVPFKRPEIIIKTDSMEGREYKYNSRQTSQDSVSSENRWQNMSFDDDYTASTASTEDYSDEDSLIEDVDRETQLLNDEETYNPRDKPIRPSPIRESEENEDEDNSEKEVRKLSPLPDPNFIPKPILKRRGLDTNKTLSTVDETKSNDKKTKEDKMTIFKKITKIPIQKPLSFQKIINKKEPTSKFNLPIENEIPKHEPQKLEDKFGDEGRTVIDYYGNIVKEYGSSKKPSIPLYLNTEDLKSVAEKQQQDQKDTTVYKQTKFKNKLNEPRTKKALEHKIQPVDKASKQMKTNQKMINDTLIKERKSKGNPSQKVIENHDQIYTQQIILKKTERATIVIPINYEELEKKAKINVRTAIDYMVDVCLLMLAFWVYLFKDERLAIPFLILIIYRQLQETILLNIPEWVRTHTPNWLKKLS